MRTAADRYHVAEATRRRRRILQSRIPFHRKFLYMTQNEQLKEIGNEKKEFKNNSFCDSGYVSHSVTDVGIRLSLIHISEPTRH